MVFEKEILEVHVTSLAGLGASYRMLGFFYLKPAQEKRIRINFKGFAFGGHYGGHNVSIQISPKARKNIIDALSGSDSDVDGVLAEVQRRMMNNEMIVEFEKIRPETPESVDNLGL